MDITTTDPMEAAVQAVLASERPPEDETPDPEEPQEEVEAEEEPVDDAETEEETASEDEAPEEEASEEPPRFTVKVDGEEREVTLDELTRDFSGRKSIERRIQEAEVARKQAEAIFGALQGEYTQVQTLAQRLQTQGLAPAPVPPDPRLAETNPAAYVKALAKFNADDVTYRRQQGELQALQERHTRVTQAAQEAHLAEQLRMASERIPALAEPDKAPAVIGQLRETARSLGYSEAELDGITDHRVLIALDELRQWREFKAKRAEVAAKKPPTQAPRHVPPASTPKKPMSDATKAELAFRKTGSMEDAVRLLVARQSR